MSGSTEQFVTLGLGAEVFAVPVAYVREILDYAKPFGIPDGPAYLLGPTGGFIVSWLAMAAIIGVAADRGLSRRMLPLFAVMLLGDAVSFAVGYGWLVTVLATWPASSTAPGTGSI